MRGQNHLRLLSQPAQIAAGLLILLSALLLPSRAGAQSYAPPPYNARVVGMVVTPETPPVTYALTSAYIPGEGSGRPHYGLYRSADGGRTWSAVDFGGLGEITEAGSLAVDYRNPTVLYLAASTEPFPYGSLSLYRSVAGGAWERLSGPIQGLSALAVDLKDSNVLYAGARYGSVGGFIQSRDGGRTWAPFDRAWPDPTMSLPASIWRAPVRRILVDPGNPDILYASLVWDYRYREGRLFRGDRNGNWVQIAAPVPSGGVLSVEGIAFDPTTRSLYAGSGPWGGGGTVSPAARKLWRSDNPFASDPAEVAWTEVASFDLGQFAWQSPLPSVDPLAVDARNGTRVYVETQGADSALWAGPPGEWQSLPIPRPIFSAPGADATFAWTSPDTGHTTSGEWLSFLKAHGDTDNLGYPRSEVIADPMAAGQTVQYFQRLVLEWHPENPPVFRIQRRLLGDLLYPGADPAVDPADPTAVPAGESHYFPNSPGLGLGHFVGDFAPDGSPTYFREYFDSHGGVDAFGFPKEEPKLRDGRWTQRFQAAVFEYHPENDVDGSVPGTAIPLRNYRVQLELLGDRYVELNHLPYR
ncbi:MAG TPA: hypothetical protein VF960_09115 [Chloroflexota bacterium]